MKENIIPPFDNEDLRVPVCVALTIE